MLRQQLNEALKEAMRAKDRRTLGTVRLVLAGLKDRDIQARTSGQGDCISDDEILDLLQKMVKQRREAMDIYAQGKRPDLVEKEAAEIEVLERFLPRQLDDSETESAVSEMIEELEAGNVKDMGRVMAALKERYAGRMDFARASQQVKQALV
ncbi:MAG: GatB/YqeY domain-containing protein [Rhodovibrionaceae bacterium]